MGADGELRLDDRQQDLRNRARAFARDEVRPSARSLDRVPDPAAAFPRELVRRASDLGLRTMAVPVEHGGAGADMLSQVIVLEELCAGDVGFGSTLAHGWREGAALARFTDDGQRARFLPGFMAGDAYVTSLALTEPHAGTDNAVRYDDSLDAGTLTRAELLGTTWLINGRKRFITNGNVADIVLLVARTDATVPWTQGISLFLVPSRTPGFRLGRVEDKLGLRLNQSAELVFDDCRIPRENLLGDENDGLALLNAMLAGSKAKKGAKCVGIAQAAYDEAVAFARTRVQGGRPIIEHGAVATVLAELGMEIEAARTIVWRAAWAVDHDPAHAAQLETIAKVYGGEVGRTHRRPRTRDLLQLRRHAREPRREARARRRHDAARRRRQPRAAHPVRRPSRRDRCPGRGVTRRSRGGRGTV